MDDNHRPFTLDYIKYIRLLTRPSMYTDIIRFDELLSKTVQRVPNHPALIYKGIVLTYENLERLTNAIARVLVEDYEIEKNTVIGLTASLCPETIILYLAISRIGAIVSPMNPFHVERDIEYQLNNSGAKMVVVDTSKFSIVKKIWKRLPELKYLLWYGIPNFDIDSEKNIFFRTKNKSTAPFEVLGVTSDDVVALPYSSGTTGLPKGVMLTHRNLISNAFQFINAHLISDLDVIFNGLPLLINLHIGAGIASGAKQILLDKWDLKYMLHLAKKHGATSIYTVVPMVNEMPCLENLESYKIPSLKFIAVGASLLAPEVAKKVSEKLGVYVVQGFGAQETSTLTHALPMPLFNGMLIPAGACGIPVADTEYRIVNILNKDQESPLGEPGELLIKGPQVMKGYWKNEDKMQEVFHKGWYKTGDIVKQDNNGIIYFVAREKDVIKSGGHTISPVEIEKILKEHKDVKD